jgi:hypothetical protein
MKNWFLEKFIIFNTSFTKSTDNYSITFKKNKAINLQEIKNNRKLIIDYLKVRIRILYT